MKITPLIKGVITGLLMLAASLLLFYNKIPTSSSLSYIVYLLYAGGIAWTLSGYTRTPGYTGKFKDLFAQGFRCFVIVTLIMVVYTIIFIKTNPGIIDQAAELHKQGLIKEGNLQLPEIEKQVEEGKKQFMTSYVSLTTFATLITGAIFTAAGALLISMRKK